MKTTFRQGIIRHQTDAFDSQQFLQLSGGNVNLLVSPDPTIVTMAHGLSEYLLTEAVTVNAAWPGPFTVSKQYWLYWDISTSTGIRTFGNTALAPITQSSPPTAALDQHWFDTAQNKMKVWNGSKWVEVIRTFAAMLYNNTFTSVSINAPDFRGTQVGLVVDYASGGIAFDASGRPIRNSNRSFFTTEDLFTANTPSGSSLKINTIIVNAQAQEPLAAFQVVMFDEFNAIVHANPYLQNTHVFGILEEDAATGETVRVVTEGRLTYDQWDWEAAGAGVNDFLYIDETGALVLAPVIGDQPPVGQIIDVQTILFRPYAVPAIGAGGTLDHNELINLGDDDHTQYFNSVRGDIRYYPRTELDPVLADKSEVGHTHLQADIIDFFPHAHAISDVTGLQTVLDLKVSLTGDTMNTGANLTFDTGEVLGLPAVPSADDAAASKKYVDDSIIPLPGAGTNITIGATIDVSPQGVGSALDADLWDGQDSDITGAADGEVLTYQGGVWINAAVASGGSSSIEDTDGDTYIKTEATNDSDTILMVLGESPNDVADDYITPAVIATLGRPLLEFTALSANDIDAGSIVLKGGDTTETYNFNTYSMYGARVEIEGGKLGQDGGDVNLVGGSTTNGGYPGGVNISAGVDALGADSGIISIVNTTVTDGGGSVNIAASIATAGDGGTVQIRGGAGRRGGRVDIYGGDSTDSSSPSTGDVNIHAGDVSSGSATGGHLSLKSGQANGTGSGGAVLIEALSGQLRGGDVEIQAGAGVGSRGGYIHLLAGISNAAEGGEITLTAGRTNSTDGGDITLEGGDASNGTGRGGDVVLAGGEGSNAVRAGNVVVSLFQDATANGVMQIKADTGGGTHNPAVQLFTDDNTNYINIQAPAGLGGIRQFTLPPDEGTVDYLLRTDGSGVTTWVAPPAGGGGGGTKIEDGDGDTWVDTDVGDADNDEVIIHLGDDGDGFGEGNVAEFLRTRINFTGLTSVDGSTGQAINITSGNNTSTGRSGNIDIRCGYSDYNWGGGIDIVAGVGGDLGGSNERGGNVFIAAGDGGGAYGGYDNTGGHAYFRSGGGYSGQHGDVWVFTPYNGFTDDATASSGSIYINTGYNRNYYGTVGTGDINIYTGYAATGGGGDAGDINITAGDRQGGYAAGGNGGNVVITSGSTDTTAFLPGNVVLVAGNGVDGPGSVDIKNINSAAAGTVNFYDNNDSNFVALKAPGTVTTNASITLPQDAPAVGEILQSDASGITSWETVQYIEQFTANTSFTVTHGLGQRWCTVQVYNTSTGVNIVPTSVTLTDASNCTVVIGASTAVTVVVIGMANVPVN